MKNYNHFIISVLTLMLFISCQDDDNQFGAIEAPSNLQIEHTIVNADAENEFGDGSGMVNFTATADNAINYKFLFGDSNVENQTNGSASHAYALTGVNTYTVTVIASGVGGTTSSATSEVTVLSLFSDQRTKDLLTGGEGQSKTWYVAKEESGHLGVGPLDSATPDFFAAPANGLADCFYDEQITIADTGESALSFNHDNGGVTFFNAAFNSVGGGGGPDDQCLPFDVSGEKSLTLSSANSTLPSDLTVGTQLNISDDGFFSYYINTSSYEVLDIGEDYLFLRALSGQANPLAWYLKFTTNPDGSIGDSNSNELQTEYTDEVFSEEFDVNGAPDPNIWNLEIGNGDNGWGNEELQYYTEDNVIVEDGFLKITAKREQTNGFDFSSTRMTTLDKFDFEYGRIEVRAKLPEGGGTWPAIWMLGSNFPEVGWPETGEIDIMEHKGNDPGVVYGSLHFPGNSGGNAVSETTTVQSVSEEFNNYTVEWSADRILFAVNDEVYHEFTNTSSTPFNNPFFLILNVAMGGTFGGDVDPAFTESTMEVDYIRVYQ
ncbi:family 16 glycosylhydrolase [Psychroflexus salinarum]|uniref:Family 16 glycosylhydrolase n=1 Tax=Psychroflexus salinarum TaxID=546024 RepID=A0ABW3GPE3_9FLAO